MNIFDLSLRLKGFPIQEARVRLAEVQALDSAEFLEWQDEARWAIARHHLQFNRFYGEHAQGAVDRWEDLPILDKQDLQLPIEELLAEGYSRRSVHVDNTSGSSGHPFWYAKDYFCHAMSWALIEHRYGLHGLTSRSRQARFYGIPKNPLGRLKETTKDWVMNRRRFPVFDLSDEALGTYVDRFRSDQFEYVYGYTQALVLFAQYLLRKEIVLANVCPTLRCGIVTSEVCREEDRTVLADAFGLPIVNEYGASEASIIAFDFPGLGWLLSEETLFVEATPGGELLITSLFNRAYPLIRYRIGDLGTLGDERVASRYRRLHKLEGRTNDVVYLPSGRTAAGLTFYYVCRGILERSDVVKEFIVRQVELGAFVLDVISDRELTPGEVRLLEEEAARYLEPGLEVRINRVDKIERPASGKIRQFYSQISAPPVS